MNGMDEMIEDLNQTTQGLKSSADIEKIIGIIRSELYTYFANVNNMLSLFIEKNEKLTEEQVKEWKQIIGENNKKFELMRSEIHNYLENNNKLFKELIEEVKGIKIEKPLIIPPSMEVPEEMVKTLKEIKVLQEKTYGELEGLYFYTGQKKVNTAGSPERLAHKIRTKSVVIIAESGNTGTIYVGGEGVGPNTAGAKLRPGESIPMDVDMMKKEVWIDAAHSGDGVTFVAMAYKKEMMHGGSK